MKRELIFDNCKESLFDDKIILRSQQRFRSDHHNVYTEEVNKIALSSNDDKRIQTYDKFTTYPYRTNVFKVCEGEMLLKKMIKILSIKMENNKLQETTSKLAISRNKAQIFKNKSQIDNKEPDNKFTDSLE